MLAIDATDLRRVYPARRKEPPRAALDGVSLRVGEGECVALLGPNGSGKSTLLRILSTLDAQDSGSLAVLGQDPRRALREVRAQLGVVFQRDALDPLLTVRENLLNHAAMFGMTRPAAGEAAESAAKRLGVHDRFHDRVGSLSGGLKRRADLARALLSEPRLLLLDEPTTGLDLGAREAFMDAIDALREERTLGVVLSTHLMEEAMRAERVVMLCEGKVVADDTPGALCASMGGAVLRVARGDAHLLRAAGLTVRDAGADAIAAGTSDQLAAAAASLASGGVAFSHALPTLADAYTARTGRALHASEGVNEGGNA